MDPALDELTWQFAWWPGNAVAEAATRRVGEHGAMKNIAEIGQAARRDAHASR